jgi:4-hydroxy-3-methylbut-2-enyl diphosphate reductase IspH
VLAEQRELKLVGRGYTIVLLGTPKHPETIGLLGHAPDAIVVDEDRVGHHPRRKRALMSKHQPPWSSSGWPHS